MSQLQLFFFYISRDPVLLLEKKKTHQKCDIFTFSCTVFLFPLVLMLCDCMFQRGSTLVGACCVQFAVMICYHEAFVDIPSA